MKFECFTNMTIDRESKSRRCSHQFWRRRCRLNTTPSPRPWDLVLILDIIKLSRGFHLLLFYSCLWFLSFFVFTSICKYLQVFTSGYFSVFCFYLSSSPSFTASNYDQLIIIINVVSPASSRWCKYLQVFTSIYKYL